MYAHFKYCTVVGVHFKFNVKSMHKGEERRREDKRGEEKRGVNRTMKAADMTSEVAEQKRQRRGEEETKDRGGMTDRGQ